MSNVFDKQNDEREVDECGCVDADGGGFCGGTGVAVAVGKCIRLDEGESVATDTGEWVGADAGGDARAGVETDVGAGTGAGVGVGKGEERGVSTSDGKVAWGFRGKVLREADMSDGCTTMWYGGDVN